jgi:hypothetical protein
MSILKLSSLGVLLCAIGCASGQPEPEPKDPQQDENAGKDESPTVLEGRSCTWSEDGKIAIKCAPLPCRRSPGGCT